MTKLKAHPVKGWERAALVFAWTEPAQGSGARNDLTSRESARLTIQEFADRDINGLSHHETVTFYRNNWTEPGEGGDPNPARNGAGSMTISLKKEIQAL